jgi:hypothetical protein
MKKLLSAICIGIAVIFLIGCSNPTAVKKVKFIGFGVSGYLHPGVEEPIYGIVYGYADIASYSITVSQKNGPDVSSLFTINKGSYLGQKIDLHVNANATITASSGTSDGTYTIIITATVNDGQVFTAQEDFEVLNPVATPILEKTVTLGAQGSTTNPTLLDVDKMATFSLFTWNQNDVANTDIILYFKNGALNFISPRAMPDTTVPLNSWITKANSLFKKVAATSYDAATSQELINQIWASVPDSMAVQTLPIAANDVIAVRTSNTVYKILKVNSISANDATGLVSVSGKY